MPSKQPVSLAEALNWLAEQGLAVRPGRRRDRWYLLVGGEWKEMTVPELLVYVKHRHQLTPPRLRSITETVRLDIRDALVRQAIVLRSIPEPIVHVLADMLIELVERYPIDRSR